jgi:hypothetical protein
MKSPLMVNVVAVSESDQKSRIGDPSHFFEKPLRSDRSPGPETLPAK